MTEKAIPRLAESRPGIARAEIAVVLACSAAASLAAIAWSWRHGALLNWERLGPLSSHPQISVKIGKGQWAKSGGTELVIAILPMEPRDKGKSVHFAVSRVHMTVNPEPMVDR